MDDIAAAAWGDDNSPGHSPTLNERDIWGAPERPALQERDEAAGRVGGDTMLHVDEEEQGVDVWAVPSEKVEDTVASPKTLTTNDTPMEEPSTTSPNINTAAAVSSLATESETSPKGEEAGATPLSILTSADNTSTHFQNEEEDSFADFEDEPFPTLATVASPSSALPVPASTSETFRNNNSNHEKEQADGFANPLTAAPAAAAADDFADFGDFEDFDDDDQDGDGVGPATAFPSSEYQNPAVLSDGFGSSERGVVTSGFGGGGEFTEEPLDVWDDPDRPAPLKSLSLDPFPPPDLTDQISTLLSRIFPNRDDPAAGENLTREGIRQVEGVNQVLVTDASRELYTQLVTPPLLKPLDWKRSRTRREQLISLGIPVNLDEVDTSRLPPLKITTKEGQAAALAAARGRPERQRTRDERMLGDLPPFDRERAERLLSYREDQLSLVPPAYLTRMQQDLVSTLSSASAVVAHLKQTRDALTEDNKAKNEQIAGLIAQAQRMKAAGGGGGGGVFRKASVRHRASNSLSLSGGNTPRRVNSPGMMR